MLEIRTSKPSLAVEILNGTERQRESKRERKREREREKERERKREREREREKEREREREWDSDFPRLRISFIAPLAARRWMPQRPCSFSFSISEIVFLNEEKNVTENQVISTLLFLIVDFFPVYVKVWAQF